MKYCPNPDCPYFIQIGKEAEYRDDIEICSDCHTGLVNGEAPSRAEGKPDKDHIDNEPPEIDDSPEEPPVIVRKERKPSQAQIAASGPESEDTSSTKYCPNPDCPYFLEIGIEAEFRDDVEVCSDCHTQLVKGESPSRGKGKPEEDFSDPEPLVIVRNFQVPFLAHLAKGKLESEGIAAFVKDEYEYTAGIYAVRSLAEGGVKVVVAESDFEKADEILKEADSNDPVETEKESEEYGPSERCPKCGSRDLSCEEVSQKASALKCISCGHRWKYKPD